MLKKILKKIFDWFRGDTPLLDYPSKEEYFSRRDKLENHKQEEYKKDVQFVLNQAREGLKKAMWAGESVFRVGDEKPRKDQGFTSRIWDPNLRKDVAKILKQELIERGFSVQPLGYNDYYVLIEIERG